MFGKHCIWSVLEFGMQGLTCLFQHCVFSHFSRNSIRQLPACESLCAHYPIIVFVKVTGITQNFWAIYYDIHTRLPVKLYKVLHNTRTTTNGIFIQSCNYSYFLIQQGHTVILVVTELAMTLIGVSKNYIGWSLSVY